MPRKAKQFKLHVKKGDRVRIITGNYKGQIGIIKNVLIKTSQVIITNINLKTKHLKPKDNNSNGQIIKMEAPIHSSNVVLYHKKL